MRTAISIVATILLLVTVWLGREAAGSSYAQESPRLASLEIDIWPEFDQPAALVLLRAEIAGDVSLPATVSLRLPTSSGGPAALASAASTDDPLFNLPYQRTDSEADFMTVEFTTEERFFQVEFYDQLPIDTPDRSYTYVWPGDLHVDQLSLEVKQPAGASDLSVTPELGPGVVDPDGLFTRRADLGAFDVGNGLTIDVRYSKTDPRTSAEILGLATPTPPSGSEDTGSDVPLWLLLLPVLAALVIGASAVALWRRHGWPFSRSPGRITRAARRREQTTGKQKDVASFCTECGNRLRSRDRFCSECGTPTRPR